MCAEPTLCFRSERSSPHAPSGRHDPRGFRAGSAAGLRGFARRTKVLYTVRARRVRPSVRLVFPSGRVVFRARDGPNTSPVDTRQQYITRPTVQTGASLSAPLPRAHSEPYTYIRTYPRAHLHITSPKNLAAPSDVRLDGRRVALVFARFMTSAHFWPAKKTKKLTAASRPDGNRFSPRRLKYL